MNIANMYKQNGGESVRYLGRLFIFFLVIFLLDACSNKEKKVGQVMAKVDGEEITVLQINDELRRSGLSFDNQDVATKRLLETLIDRQLILAEALRHKVDRSPETLQAIERARSQIIVQAYLKKAMSQISKPTANDIHEYFIAHPEYFTKRKQFDLQQLILAANDVNNELKSIIDDAHNLESVATWLDKHNVKYKRGSLSRNTSDMPEMVVDKLKEMKRGQLFIISEGENTMLNFISDIKSSPVSEKASLTQIEQYLYNKKTKEAMDAELTHLRSLAKIEYQNITQISTK